ncbi:hypothetical protein VMF7928_02475 [Vibrio marisflavi CECT 7928]|uniref:Uncharacterized protein n=1 Tax=Vibrio marisflavi CECT 7928 TaxID=634439 RepID=A0ABN8E6F7_9VIBR|nr:hypothetical protein VMF7928_02475 [Vibrio marisflavi CECT 7928]
MPHMENTNPNEPVDLKFPQIVSQTKVGEIRTGFKNWLNLISVNRLMSSSAISTL